MNILKAIEKLHYKLALVKEVLFNDARPVKPSLQDKDIDEITGRDKKIRELEAKKGKNWAEADRIRNELLSEGITLLDKPNGVVWKLNDGTEHFYDK